jgi:Threonine dehydrogenase and related Zn-dependent dehydrogenases
MGHPAPEFARREGAYSEYVKVKESEAFPIPDTVSYEEGALIEPFAVAMHALEQSGAKPGMDILILGAGTIGLCMVMAAKLYGIAKIYIFDNVDYRLQVAESMGAMSLKTNVENLAEMIKEKTSGHGVDIVLEASGAEVIYQTITYMVKNGGVICFVGMSTQEYFSINVSDIINRELKITSNFRYANLYPKIIKLIGTGNLQLKNLITHRFSLENINEAMLTTFERKDTCIKAIISM